jgi:hypothetical protein
LCQTENFVRGVFSSQFGARLGTKFEPIKPNRPSRFKTKDHQDNQASSLKRYPYEEEQFLKKHKNQGFTPSILGGS